jgi:hypothetical protein
MPNAPAPLRFACEAVDSAGQASDVRASFQNEERAKTFVVRNPVPAGFTEWRIRDCETSDNRGNA